VPTERPIIRPARLPADYDSARKLFLEYATQLDFSLCFQSFDEELTSIEHVYSPHEGELLIAEIGGIDVGCGGLKRLETGVCEMKRLFVRNEARGIGLGRDLATAIIQIARERGYTGMRLDTIGATMATAVALYRSLGFREIPAYYPNPIPGALYMELDLIESNITGGVLKV